MTNSRGLWSVLKSGTSDHWGAIIKQTLYNSILGLIPIWFGLALIEFGTSGITWRKLAEEGEFALYAASLLGTVFYQLFRDYKKNEFPWRHWFGLIGISLMLGSVLIYLVHLGFSNIKRESLVFPSLIIYGVCQILAVVVGMIDLVLGDMDYEGDNRRAVDALASEMDAEGASNG